MRLDELPGETAYIEVAAPFVTGVHQVDSPAFDRHGNLYVTFSGSRGQQAPVAIFLVRPDGTREPFVTGIANPTSLAFDPDGRLYVSSRFDGSVYRIEPDGRADVVRDATWASRAGWRSGRAARCSSAIARERSSGSKPRARRAPLRRCPPASRPFISPSVPTMRCTWRRRRSAPTT